MNDKDLIIVFARNSVLGKVKKRLAEKVGDENALKIHDYLLKNTLNSVSHLNTEKAIYFSDFIPEENNLNTQDFDYYVQEGKTLGERMENAFNNSFKKNYTRVVLIGSDIYNLRTGILNRAFEILTNHDMSIGPAFDGGYYLIGMKEIIPLMFQEKEWGTNKVFKNTIEDMQELGIKFKLLPVLNDIDKLDDLKNFKDLTSLISFEKINVN